LTAALTEPDLQRRFSGLERLYGVAGASRIRAAHVAVIGIGGVGSWAAEALARSGVGRLTLIDLDHVAESNINRQIHALDSTVGQAKVAAMRERIAQINPACVVHGIEEFVEPSNWPQILPAGVDAVIDACDQIKAKTAMAVWARQNTRIVRQRRGRRRQTPGPQGRRGRPGPHHPRPAAGPGALPPAQGARRPARGQNHGRDLCVQPRGSGPARSRRARSTARMAR
jgi:hypothetical protein